LKRKLKDLRVFLKVSELQETIKLKNDDDLNAILKDLKRG
jgi:hypothetical protein